MVKSKMNDNAYSIGVTSEIEPKLVASRRPVWFGRRVSGLLFPLSVRLPGSEYELVRTILGIDREAGTITFAGDVPEGATARLMRANPDRLIDGAVAATAAAAAELGTEPEFTLLVSCVGRKWALGPRIDEEVEEASGVVRGTPTVGFYSYGELAPAAHGSPCELHNQTLTVTAFSEA